MDRRGWALFVCAGGWAKPAYRLRADLLAEAGGGYSVCVARRVFQFVAGVVLLLATLTPLANCFDTWDKTSQPPASDTEIHLTALFVVAGFAMVLPNLIRRVAVAAVDVRQFVRRERLGASPRALCWALPEPSASPPPLPLRI